MGRADPGAGARPCRAREAAPRAGDGGGAKRLAGEAHDTLAQGCTSIVVLAQTAAAVLSPDTDGVAERLALIEEPVTLDSATLVEALERLVERFGRETGLARWREWLAD